MAATASAVALAFGFFGAALVVGVQVGVRVYRPPDTTIRFFDVISRIAALIACAGTLVFVALFLFTGTGPRWE